MEQCKSALRPQTIEQKLGGLNVTNNAFLSLDCFGVAEELRRNIEKVSMASGRKWGQPKEISNAILFLASQCSSYVNGAALQIDGGSFNTSYITELHARRDTLAKGQ